MPATFLQSRLAWAVTCILAWASTTPVPGAKVEIWQADRCGGTTRSTGDASQYTAGQPALGYVLADKDGYYEFTSIYPGYYPGRTTSTFARRPPASVA